MNKKINLIFGIVFLFIILINLTSAANVCCEKTKTGAWCQNEDEAQCLGGDFKKAPTSCEATSFCKMGTCVNVKDGTCTENTPESVCNEAEGIWKDEPAEDISQCNLGCCLIGDQAAFVTQTRCKRLSSSFGLETSFRTDIQDEVTCIANARSEEEGACVFDSGFEKTCKRLTKQECLALKEKPSKSIFDLFDSTPEVVEGVSFYPGKLCTDTELETNCAKTKQTTCVEGKDEVYFVDSCGNIANIYNYEQRDKEDYWKEIKTKDESCNSGKSNAGSATCGNCDYYLGSTCKAYKRTEDRVAPSIGNNICKDLGCTWEGEKYEHGETWCAGAVGEEATRVKSGDEKNLPGSRSFRLVCYNSEVSIEPCAEFRNQICIESEVNSFSTAGCRDNIWQECILQEEEKDCLNEDRRDCKWIGSGNYNDKGEEIDVCVPKYPPGFDFWQVGDAEEICDIASTQVIVTYQKKIQDYIASIWGNDDWKCDDSKPENNCFASKWKNQQKAWLQTKEEFCSALGDCGSKTNYLGFEGYHNSALEVEKA